MSQCIFEDDKLYKMPAFNLNSQYLSVQEYFFRKNYKFLGES